MRVLIVGCGCRGRHLAQALQADGHLVRGTTRSKDCLFEIEKIGAEAVLADPVRVGALLPLLADVSAVVWLMGTAEGPSQSVQPLFGSSLQAMLEKIVDTQVRGFVFEATGSVGEDYLKAGADLCLAAANRWSIPTRIVESALVEHEDWRDSMVNAVNELLGA